LRKHTYYDNTRNYRNNVSEQIISDIYRDYIDSKVTARTKQHAVKNEYQRRVQANS